MWRPEETSLFTVKSNMRQDSVEPHTPAEIKRKTPVGWMFPYLCYKDDNINIKPIKLTKLTVIIVVHLAQAML